jgi:ParB-like chromosome segregation protein Spo0J
VRDERVGWVTGLPKSAAEALKTAMAWNMEIESKGISRADIARRERLTRARITQVMSLLELPEAIRAMLLGGAAEDWSVRRALREVG